MTRHPQFCIGNVTTFWWNKVLDRNFSYLNDFRRAAHSILMCKSCEIVCTDSCRTLVYRKPDRWLFLKIPQQHRAFSLIAQYICIRQVKQNYPRAKTLFRAVFCESWSAFPQYVAHITRENLNMSEGFNWF